MYAVKLGTDLTVEVVEKLEGKGVLDFCYEQIGCSTIEIVRPAGLEKPYVMVVDEEGLMADKPALNFIGSYLYGTQLHGQPIVGHVLILPLVGEDFRLMPKEQAEILAGKLQNFAMQSYLTVESTMRTRIQR